MNVPMSRWFSAGFACLALSIPAFAGNPPPTQVFYVPFPEDYQLTAFDAINTNANAPINVFVTLSAATDGTVIYYDHWEDGYERDITNPVQSTSRIFGDGNPANGSPPGNAADLISAGTVFNLRNIVDPATLQSVIDYDARDKIATFKPISVTKLAFPDGTDTLLAGCVEVFERGIWGNEYRSPVGVDMPVSAAAGNLTFDENVFNYAAFAISAGVGGASVQIDKDNNGTYEETVILAEGEVVYRDAVNVGGHILADRPVQVILFTGTVDSNYASRDTSLLPVNRWSSDYFAPVSTTLTEGTVTFLYNPGASAITVNYDYRSSASAYTTASISVPAGGNARVVMSPSNGTTHFGAYRFYTTGGSPPLFYAMSAIDADAASGSNQNWDGGFTLVGKPSLTTQVLVSLGIGRDPYSPTSPTQNGNPVWITTSGNGNAQETVYVDYNGDNAGPLTDPNGNRYDIAYNLRELEQLKIFDPDGDQSGMLVYTLNSTVKIAAVWGQDPSVASVAQPGLDVASLVPPLREGDAGKISSLSVDADGDGFVSAGDTLEYDIRAVNNARSTIPGPFGFLDNLPADTTYVPNSTRYRYSVGGIWQPWINVADNGSGTAYPLDGAGLPVPGSIQVGQQLQVVFRAAVDTYVNLSGGSIVNSGIVEISPYGLVLPVGWTDLLHGSIGDRIWTDLDGDGVQDAGEAGISGIDVYADLNNNSTRDTGEPWDTTDSNGNYLLPGLLAGTYAVRVDSTDIAAANVGYGPTYDLDGIATSHVATVTLAAAQDRVDVDFGYRVGASIGDRVWIDRDTDGVQEAGEPGINGVRVYVDANNNNAYDVGERNTITSGDGVYYIGNLAAGTYNVRVDTATLPGGTTQTFDLNGGLDHEAAVTLLGAEHRGDLDFGYRGVLSLGDLVWEDIDANGLLIDIISSGGNGGMIDMNRDGAITTADAGLLGGYNVVSGRLDVDGDGGGDNDDDINTNTFLGLYRVTNGRIDINLSSDGAVTTADVGRLSGEQGIPNIRVYLDFNGNGVFESTEPSAVTNASGIYTIGNLFNGSYTVRVDTTTLPSSYAQTYDLVNPSTDHTAVVTLGGASRTDVDFGYRNDASLGDLVWNDRDADGVRDAGEPGIEGVLVYIDADNDNLFDQGLERFATTDVNGYYLIPNLSAGSYNVRIEISTLPQGAGQTYDLSGTLDHEAARTLTGAENATNVDFGYRATASVGDFVWTDSDNDGVQDVGETGIAGVRVYLDVNGNSTFDSATEPSATTDSAGAYTIGNLVPGTYTARVDTSTLTAGLLQTYDATGGLDHAATFSLSASQVRTDIDFGYTAPVSIGNFVWHDQDGDGQQDVGEPGLAGVTVTACHAANDAVVGTFTTLAGGAYSFTGLLPGSYYVVFGALSGYQRTVLDQGADATDSDANRTTGRTPSVTLTGGQSNLTLDAGYFQPGTITGTIFADTNNDNTGDVAISGVTLTLKDSSGNDIDSDPNTAGIQPTVTTTNASGVYTFSNLPPGSYRVVETQPSGYLSVSDVDGLNNNVIGDQTPITLTSGQTRSGNNFVEEQPGTISGTVFADTNNDNVGDVGIAGVTLTLYTDPNGDGDRADGVAYGSPFVTIAGGTYSFTNLPPGAYVVEEAQPSGYLTVTDVDSTIPGDDALNSSTTDNSIPAAVTANEADTGNDFIEEQPGTISGTVFADTDNNDTGDVAISSVTITLRDSSGNDIDSDPNTAGIQPTTTTTNASGVYTFSNVPPGSYRVVETQPAGYLTVTDGDTTTPGDDAANVSTTDNFIPVSVTAGETDNGNNFVEEQPGTISGTVFADTNNDNVGDVGIAGVTLTLYTDPNGDGNRADGVAYGSPFVTSAGGTYSFTNLPPGAYVVEETQPSGYLTVTDVDSTTPGDDASNSSSTDNSIPAAVTANEADTGNDFIEEQPGTISGTVFADTDNNDTGDVAISGVTITLRDSSGNDIDSDPNTAGIQPTTTTTNASGVYTFSNVPPGSYRVVETQPAGYLTVTDGDTTTPGDDAANVSTTDNFIPVSVTAGETDNGNNFIEEQPGTISGSVFADTNNDNVGDVGIAGVTLTLYTDPNGDGNRTDGVAYGSPFVTSAGGTYSFTNLPPGAYVVEETQPSGYLTVTDVDSTTPGDDASNSSSTDNSIPAAVTANEADTGNDFIEEQPGTISGTVFADTDNNDTGDVAISGVTITLRDSSGNDIDSDPNTAGIQPTTTTTNASGVYTFSNVPPGSYRVVETQPAGYLTVTDGDTTTPGDDAANVSTTDNFIPVSVTAGETDNGNNFIEEQPGTISGSVFADTNNDNVGDVGIVGVTLTLYTDPNGDGNRTDGVAYGSPFVTSAGGTYSFTNLPPGAYVVEETQPSGYLTVTDVDSTTPGDDASNSSTTDNSIPAAVTANEADTGNDFIEEQPGTISGTVFADTNNDNVGDVGIAGVTLTLYTDPNGDGNRADGVAYGSPFLTIASGTYSFTNLPPGAYVVEEAQPSGYLTVTDVDSTTPGDDASNSSTTDNSIPAAVTANEADTGNDFIEEQPGTISGTVFADTDNNDTGDVALSGVTITLKDFSGNDIDSDPNTAGIQPTTTTTNASGVYTFSNVPPGSYRVVETQPAGYLTVTDGDTTTPGDDSANISATDNFIPVSLTAGEMDNGNDFVEEQPGTISGTVFADTNNDDTGDVGIAGVALSLYSDPNGDGNPADGVLIGSPVVTLAGGAYSFTNLPPGSYVVVETQPSGYFTVTDVDSTTPGDDAVNSSITDNLIPSAVIANETDTGNDFVEEQPGSISGTVLADTDDDGDGDLPLTGVTVRLIDNSGNPVLDAFGDPVISITLVNGTYSFTNLPPGSYQVYEDQPAGYNSVSDTDGLNNNRIGDQTPIVVTAGNNNSGSDFVEIELGAISGFVYVGSTALSGVTLTLLDEFGNPVDGDPNTPGLQPITTVTNSLGYYSFTGVVPGTYQVGQKQPYGYDSFGDIDGGDINIIGDISPITIAPGQHSEDNNFIETLDTCPDDWEEWKYQHPSQTVAGNPDADAYDNFAEFAFAMPYDRGTGSPWLGNTAWIIQPSTLAAGTIEGVFVRPKGAPLNVTYTLQYAATPADPTVWKSLVITPLMYTTVDNGDCTETVTLHDLETLTGLSGGKGVVRIQADLDDDGGGDGDLDHTSHTETEGWTVTGLEICCRTYNNPYQRETIFTGTAAAVNGQDLTFAAGDSLGALLASGGSFYLEVISGDNEGHRFDLVSASGNTVTLANDGSLQAAAAPFNTLTGPPPASLAGDRIAIHRHWTLGEIFPTSGFGATGSQSSADQVQVFSGGAWTIYWLYDGNDADPTTSLWVDAADAGMQDMGAVVIPPGQGVFFNNRAGVTSILAYGEIRQNDFIRPHAPGNNLVGGGYPIDQSPNGIHGRAMSLATGFFGSRDFKTADSIFIWKADTTIGAAGYDTYYLLAGIPSQPALTRWIRVGDATILARDAETLLPGNRSVFTRTAVGLPLYTSPSPWSP